MVALKLVSFLIFVSFISASIQEDEVVLATEAQEYVRACYLTNWAQYRQFRAKFTPENYIPGLCTHIIFAHAWIDEQFNVKAFDTSDKDTRWSTGLYTQVNDLKQSDPGLKTIISIGGWRFGTRIFKSLSSSSGNRRKFVSSVVDFMSTNGFDGVNIDWQYPIGQQEKSDFTALIQELDNALSAASPDLSLSIVISAGKGTIDNAYDIPQLAPFIDFALLYSYDYHGAWENVTGLNSPLYPSPNQPEYAQIWNLDFSANYVHESGLPKEKVIIGLPAYARGWTLEDENSTGIGALASGPARVTKFVGEEGVAAYYEICEMIAGGAELRRDDFQKVPYLIDGNQWYTYDDKISYLEKLEWLKVSGFGGVFVWSLDLDDFNGECSGSDGTPYPLINLVAQELAGKTFTTLPTTPGSTFTTITPPETTVALSSTTTKPRSTDSTTTTAPPIDPCLGASEGFMMKSASCSQFLLCYIGQSYVLDCPSGLFFEESLGYCVRQIDSSCNPLVKTTTPSTIGTLPPGGKCTGDGFFADPASCAMFFQCANGIKYSFTCPDGLNFDIVSQRCEFPDRALCGN